MPSMTLPEPWRKLLLTVHVTVTVSVLGADLVLLALGIASLNGTDQLTIYPAAQLIAAWLVAPLAVLALASGVLLGLLTPWGVFRYWWTTIKLALTALLTGVVLFVLVPRLGTADERVSAPVPDLLSQSERIPLVAAPAVASSLLVLMVVLGVFKPGWRVRSGSRHEIVRRSSQTEQGSTARHS